MHHALQLSVVKMSTSEEEKMRTSIQFCVNLGKTPTETKTMMETAYGKKSVNRSLVYKWHKRFCDGRSNVEDDERCGRPVDVTDEENVTLVKSKLDEDRSRVCLLLCVVVLGFVCCCCFFGGGGGYTHETNSAYIHIHRYMYYVSSTCNSCRHNKITIVCFLQKYSQLCMSCTFRVYSAMPACPARAI